MNTDQSNPVAETSTPAPKAATKSASLGTTRLIIKNIPKHITEDRLRQHFSSKGVVTDAKIMKKGDKSRLFGFIGFKTEAEAIAARKFFNGTFIDTSRMVVDFAKP
jgi:multiple RNA-binding domain-containing protein 1